MTVRFVTSSHKNVCPLLTVKSEFLGYNAQNLHWATGGVIRANKEAAESTMSPLGELVGSPWFAFAIRVRRLVSTRQIILRPLTAASEQMPPLLSSASATCDLCLTYYVVASKF